MPRFGGGRSQSLERTYPVDVDELFGALLETVPKRFKLKTTDDFTRSCNFSSSPSAMTWGENFSAQVIAGDGGALVRAQAVGKVGGQIAQSSRSNKLMNELFTDLSRLLQAKTQQ